jgi:hypothetical protein
MHTTGIKEKIATLLEEIMERSLHISRPDNKDPLLDVDLVMDDLRSLYREYEKLRRALEQPHTAGATTRPVHQPASPTIETVDKQEEKPQREEGEKPEEIQANKPEEKQVLPDVSQAAEEAKDSAPIPEPPVTKPQAPEVEPQQATEEVRPEPEQQQPLAEETPREVAPKVEAPEPPQKPEVSATPQKKEPASQASKPSGSKAIIDLFSEPIERSIGDQFNAEDNSLHQRISKNKGDSSISARMQQKPIANLKEAIGVNDKFLFINELFHGNIQAYNDAITSLNNQEGIQQAFDFINELNSTFAWDEKRSAETIEKLANFVQRRYMTS